MVHNDKLYCGIENGPLFFPIFVVFSVSPDFSSKISPQPFKREILNLIWRFALTSWIVGLQMAILLFVLPCICSFFSDFSSKISPQPFKIQTLNLEYRLTRTSCNVRLKMEILLFVLSSLYFSFCLHFCQRYHPYALEALKRGYSQIFWQF